MGGRYSVLSIEAKDKDGEIIVFFITFMTAAIPSLNFLYAPSNGPKLALTWNIGHNL
jgi:hypothetical protein